MYSGSVRRWETQKGPTIPTQGPTDQMMIAMSMQKPVRNQSETDRFPITSDQYLDQIHNSTFSPIADRSQI
jgi:hypothetical protein